MKTFFLPPGSYEILAANPQLPIPLRKKCLARSNLLKINIEDGYEYYLNVCPHPLCWFGKHRPKMSQLVTLKIVECLLLLRQDEHFQDNMNRIKQVGEQIKNEIKHFTYHPVSLIFIIALSLFAMVSNIRHPDLYATGDGVAWGFLFGLSNLIGLFLGLNKQMLARGREHKLLLYTAFGALMILFFAPQAYYWQRIFYFCSALIACYWAYFSFRRWKKQMKGLDKIEQTELKLEERF